MDEEDEEESEGDWYRRRRQARQNQNQLQCQSFHKTTLVRLRRTHQVVEITPYQFRVDGVLDVYPTNRRWHLLRSGRRGGFGGKKTALRDIERLLGMPMTRER